MPSCTRGDLPGKQALGGSSYEAGRRPASRHRSVESETFAYSCEASPVGSCRAPACPRMSSSMRNCVFGGMRRNVDYERIDGLCG